MAFIRAHGREAIPLVQIIDNVNVRLGDDIRACMSPGSRIRIAAETFSIYAFEALKEELEQVEELEFIFTSPSLAGVHTDASAGAGTHAPASRFSANPSPARNHAQGPAPRDDPRQRREFFIPRPSHVEESLSGTEFEIQLRNKLTQRAVARECADWIRRKARFRENRTGLQMPGFAVIDDTTAYNPVRGFTAPDLGYSPSGAIMQLVTRMDGADQTRAFLSSFDALWGDPTRLADVTDAVQRQIGAVYAENSPARMYYFLLLHIFADFLEDISPDLVANDRTGYQDSHIWRSLYNFQKDAATGIINKLETYNGCILADSVGLGKTFTALAVIKYYELRNQRVLVLAPKKLSENWTTYNSNYDTNLFAQDHFRYDVLAHTDLLRDKGMSGSLDLARINWGNYDLVVIDESHNFRNADLNQSSDRETRYQRLLRQVVQQGVRTKVLMLSATPVNNRFLDLRNQLQLAYGDDSSALSDKLPIEGTIEQVFRDAQAVFNRWSALPPEERTASRIQHMLDFDFFEVLDAVTIARSRHHIQTYYDTTSVGAFPERLPPINRSPGLTDLPGAPTFDTIHQALGRLTLAAYTPLTYVLDSRRFLYEGGPVGAGAGGREGLSQSGREHGLQKLMTVNLLKRLESSVEALRQTLRTLIGVVDRRLEWIEHSTNDSALPASHDATGRDDLLEDLGFDDAEEAVDPVLLGEGLSLRIEDVDAPRWRSDLMADREILDDLLAKLEPVTPAHDTKLRVLVDLVRDKIRHPINPGNRKVLIFSAFADTAQYLYQNLAPALHAGGLQAGLVTGGSHGTRTTVGAGYDFQQVLTLFSPVSKQCDVTMPEAQGNGLTIDVLIGTDVISEGQNLQDCDEVVNYDIHWNPVRIIQRFGRIDRIGSTNGRIQLVNFWPDISLDEYINLKERVQDRMVIADLTGTADENPLKQGSGDDSFRREQLTRLQHEVLDLDDARTGISITDLGLSDFRMDLLSRVKTDQGIGTLPKGLHAVVPAQPAIGLVPGVIFALRNVHGDTTVARASRIHPHYLVYVARDGHVVMDQTEVRQVLETLRAGCREVEEPVNAVADIFNGATSDGADMTECSTLLNAAISSMVEHASASDAASLFDEGPTTVLSAHTRGLEDFELTGFVVIVDPGQAR